MRVLLQLFIFIFLISILLFSSKKKGTDIHIYTGNPSVLGGISF
ncbi:hypothetical protein HMPREF0106_02483 [Bacteroides sp. D22]|nr:hypothetical protein HMPREF0106_02483 [Bacteroides sp. D22]